MTRADSPARLRRGAFGCIRLVTFRRSASDPASAGGRILGRSCSILALALAVDFTLPPLIRLACGEPPSPEGEGFGAGKPKDCRAGIMKKVYYFMFIIK